MNSPTSRWTTVIGVMVAIISLGLCATGGYLAWKKASKPAASPTPPASSPIQDAADGLIQSLSKPKPISFEGKLIPTGPQVMTQAKHQADYQTWQMRKVTDAWHKTHPGQKANAEAERVLSDAWNLIQKHPGAPQPAEIRQRVKTLPAAEAGDPLMRLALTVMDEETDDSSTTLSKLKEIEKGLRKSHASLLFAAYAQLEQQDILLKTKKHKEASALITPGVDTLAEAMQNGEFTPNDTIYIFRMITRMNSYALDMGLWNRICLTVQKRTNIDPWLLDILNGQNEMNQAWGALGEKGWTKSTSEYGVRPFQLHLKQARPFLTDAWRRHPEWPQAATLMITVTMGGRGEPGVSSRDWFDRAVAARMDFPDAYNALLQDMQPRWRGTAFDMAKFALECLNTGRFDTDVPLYYFQTMSQIGEDMPPGTWHSAFRQPDVAANLDRMFEGCQKDPSRAAERSLWQARQAVAQAWCGQYERARELMKTTAPEDQLDWTQVMSFFSMGRIDRKMFEAELRAFTGPLKDTLTRADALQCSGQATQALGLFSKAMKESKADAAVFGYLRDRIANLQLDLIEGHNNDAYGIGCQPLHRTFTANQPQLARFLIENGAELNTLTADGWIPVQLPLSKGEFDLVKLMVEHGADINRTSTVSDTPLIMSIETNQRQMAEYLIAHGANLNLGAKDRMTPLYYAIMRNRREMIDLLIQKGANINLCTEGFGTPLREAAKVGNVDVARALLDRGADPSLTAIDVSTPLMCVSENGNTAIARLLLEKDANPNAACRSFTALHYAAYYGQAEVARLLVEKGASLDLKLNSGKTPLALARERKNEAVARVLEEAARKP